MPEVSVELNFYYMHYNDAGAFASLARERAGEALSASIYARHSILSVVFASEALINRVLAEFGTAKSAAQALERNGILDKWLLAPFVCAQGQAPVPFDKGAEPVQSFKELIEIRNWLAHPKTENFLPAELDPKSSISVEGEPEDYAWLEMLKGDAWRQTNIPRNPFELTHEHATAAVGILDRMIAALNAKIGGVLTPKWLNLITVKDSQGVHSYRAPVGTIWGGYGGRVG